MEWICKLSPDGFHYWLTVPPVHHGGKQYVARCTHCEQWLDSKRAERMLNAAARRHPSLVHCRNEIREALAEFSNRPEEAYRRLAGLVGISVPAVDLDRLQEMTPDALGKLRQGEFGDP